MSQLEHRGIPEDEWIAGVLEKKPPRWTRYLTWLCVALSLTGAALVSFKYPFAGSAVWVVANIGWLYDATKRKDRPQMLLWSAYLVTAVLGVWNWR